MTKKEAKEILLNFAEDNKYYSDWSGYLSGVISTYFEDEKLLSKDIENE